MLFGNAHSIGARAYREEVTIITQTSVTDEYGMQSLTTGVETITVPASVEMLSGYAKTNFYQTAEIEAYEVRMRFVPYKFEQLTWRGETLSVDSVEDVGMRGRELRVLASRRAVI